MEANTKPNLTRRERLHLWICDRLGLVTLDEYINDIDIITKALSQQDNGWKYQDGFNRYIGGLLGLDPQNPYLKKDKSRDPPMSEKEKDMYG